MENIFSDVTSTTNSNQIAQTTEHFAVHEYIPEESDGTSSEMHTPQRQHNKMNSAESDEEETTEPPTFNGGKIIEWLSNIKEMLSIKLYDLYLSIYG